MGYRCLKALYIVGPPLYLIYINGVMSVPLSVGSQLIVYANDTLLYRPISCRRAFAALQEDINKLDTWINTLLPVQHLKIQVYGCLLKKTTPYAHNPYFAGSPSWACWVFQIPGLFWPVVSLSHMVFGMKVFMNFLNKKIHHQGDHHVSLPPLQLDTVIPKEYQHWILIGTIHYYRTVRNAKCATSTKHRLFHPQESYSDCTLAIAPFFHTLPP